MSGWDVGKTFTAALARNGTALTSKDLVERYPSLSISTADNRIELDKCKFVDLFDTDPVQAREPMKRKREEVEEHYGVQYLQQILRSNHHHPLKKNRRYDFRLEPDEKAKLAGNGIVVSDRMQSKSFGDVYYQLYSDDLPVFVTADSILHAWHRSFDAFLVEIETACLAPTLHEILDAALEGPGNLLLDLQQQVVQKSRSSGIASNLSSGAATPTISFALPSYEFVTPIDQRLTDEEFEAKLPWMRAPQWAEKSYLCSAFGDASSDEEN
ncbi:uncharacterized protein KRP23_2672 [Phytophthora ramorum]|uniref:uncharacterized protein n=1 Tax=Phytophthora ramorum TaxID=164328 RepID=UPI00309D092B|nr:hypothetical protein KRP23_2672 [Phytophthora ramorum]